MASRTLAKAEQVARQVGATRAYDRFEALAADPAVDAIYIATPNHLHMEHMQFEIEEVVACLAAGKLESEIMPLSDTLTLMEIVDAVRDCWER